MKRTLICLILLIGVSAYAENIFVSKTIRTSFYRKKDVLRACALLPVMEVHIGGAPDDLEAFHILYGGEIEMVSHKPSTDFERTREYTEGEVYIWVYIAGHYSNVEVVVPEKLFADNPNLKVRFYWMGSDRHFIVDPAVAEKVEVKYSDPLSIQGTKAYEIYNERILIESFKKRSVFEDDIQFQDLPLTTMAKVKATGQYLQFTIPKEYFELIQSAVRQTLFLVQQRQNFYLQSNRKMY